MTKPDDVPQDVWDYAEAVEQACRGKPTSEKIAQHARAIMAEREACAQVADNARYTTFMQWDPEGCEPVTVAVPYREEIAVAIRNRSEA